MLFALWTDCFKIVTDAPEPDNACGIFMQALEHSAGRFTCTLYEDCDEALEHLRKAPVGTYYGTVAGERCLYGKVAAVQEAELTPEGEIEGYFELIEWSAAPYPMEA